MRCVRTLAAAALLRLTAGHAQVQRSAHALQQEDVSALVQVSLESLAEAEAEANLESFTDADSESSIPGGILTPRRHSKKVHHFSFPLEKTSNGTKYHFVGSASFNIDFAGFHVHCYDIAMYLNSSSPLWTQTVKQTRNQRIDAMLGNVQYEMVADSKYVNNANMAKFVDRLEVFAKSEGLTDYASTLTAYKEAYLKGPPVTRGSHIVLVPSSKGVTPIVSGKDMGLIDSSFLGNLVMQAYLGTESDLPEFRDSVFAQLGMGKPEEVGAPAEVHSEAGNSTWAIIIFIVIIVAIVSCCCGCLWWCYRRRTSKADGGEKLTASG